MEWPQSEPSDKPLRRVTFYDVLSIKVKGKRAGTDPNAVFSPKKEARKNDSNGRRGGSQ